MPSLTAKAWGDSPTGPATLFTLTNSKGNHVSITDYGATVTSVVIEGGEMVVGFDELTGYLGPNPYYGALVGRYGNRIARGRFSIDGESYTLAVNNGPNSLHGGLRGFDKYVWKAETATTETEAILTLHHVSPDGDEGFPGTLHVTCRYVWNDDNELRIDYRATTDKATLVNLTNHSYFNLAGGGTIEAHTLQLAASAYVPTDETQIPLGTTEPVAGTPFDFTTAKPVGQDIRANHPQITLANGYDHTWAVDGYDGTLREIAVLTEPASGRQLRCLTTEPGVQVFTANFQPGQFPGRDGKPLPTYGAICLETQHFPDAPNQAAFTTPRLNPGETYRTTTVYRFA